ncbi:MAG: transporter substrate-binding domain-containing protein [Cyanobacteria bacterium P01_E01_bin.42]
MKNNFLTRILPSLLRSFFSQKLAKNRSPQWLVLVSAIALLFVIGGNWHIPARSNGFDTPVLIASDCPTEATPASNAQTEANAVEAPAPIATSVSNVKANTDASETPALVAKTEIAPYPSDVQRLIQQGYMTVGTLGFDTPPFYFEQNGKLQGSDMELARNIGKLLDLEVRFDRNSPTFSDLIEKTARGEVDMAIGKLSVTMPRLKQLHASPSYIKFKQALLINRTQLATLGGKDSQSIQQILREEPIEIGVIGRSSYQRYAEQNFPNAKIVGFKSWTEATEAVEKGDVFAIYRDEAEIKKIMLGQPQLALKLKSVLFNDLEDNKAIFVNVNNPQLAHIIDHVLTDVYEPWTTERLIEEFHEVFTNPEFASK